MAKKPQYKFAPMVVMNEERHHSVVSPMHVKTWLVEKALECGEKDMAGFELLNRVAREFDADYHADFKALKAFHERE